MRNVCVRVAGLGLFALVVAVIPATAATITVNAGGNLQAALDNAAPGDTIVLQAGATFTGNFKLPLKSGFTYITVRSSAADSALPSVGVRITPASAAYLPKIRSGNTAPAMTAAAGAHHWKLLFLEFQANVNGYGDIIRLGSSTATSASNQPANIVIDRCFIHGDAVKGQKNAVTLHSRTTKVKNSYISDIKGIGQETHAIWGTNGPGPFTITNNFIEASGINFLFGGTDPVIFNNVPGLALAANGYGITISGNHIRKNPAWLTPFVPTPTGVSAAGSTTGGTLAAKTYFYRVAARMPSYQTINAISKAAAEVSATVASGQTGSVRITWSPVTGATTYRVFGRTSGAQNVYFDVAAASACAGSVCAYTDSGAAGTSGSVGSGTRWTVKSLIELKIAQDVLIDANLLEYNWYGAGDQLGYAMLFRSDPSSVSGAPWTVVQRVLVQNNHLRHSPGAIDIVGIDGGAGTQAVRANTITVRNNLFEDLSPAAWGGGTARFASVRGTNDVTFDHNTVVLNGPGVLTSSANADVSVSERFVYTNNMSKRGTNGVKGDSKAEGTATLAANFPGAIFRRNVVAGASASQYPTDNFFPTPTDWKAAFVDFAGGDYRLDSGSPYSAIGTDGLDLGANLDAVAGLSVSSAEGIRAAPLSP